MQVFGFCDVEESTEGQHIKLVKLVYKKDRFITVVFMYAVKERITGVSLSLSGPSSCDYLARA